MTRKSTLKTVDTRQIEIRISRTKNKEQCAAILEEIPTKTITYIANCEYIPVNKKNSKKNLIAEIALAITERFKIIDAGEEIYTPDIMGLPTLRETSLIRLRKNFNSVQAKIKARKARKARNAAKNQEVDEVKSEPATSEIFPLNYSQAAEELKNAYLGKRTPYKSNSHFCVHPQTTIFKILGDCSNETICEIIENDGLRWYYNDSCYYSHFFNEDSPRDEIIRGVTIQLMDRIDYLVDRGACFYDHLSIYGIQRKTEILQAWINNYKAKYNLTTEERETPEFEEEIYSDFAGDNSHPEQDIPEEHETNIIKLEHPELYFTNHPTLCRKIYNNIRRKNSELIHSCNTAEEIIYLICTLQDEQQIFRQMSYDHISELRIPRKKLKAYETEYNKRVLAEFYAQEIISRRERKKDKAAKQNTRNSYETKKILAKVTLAKTEPEAWQLDEYAKDWTHEQFIKGVALTDEIIKHNKYRQLNNSIYHTDLTYHRYLSEKFSFQQLESLAHFFNLNIQYRKPLKNDTAKEIEQDRIRYLSNIIANEIDCIESVFIRTYIIQNPPTLPDGIPEDNLTVKQHRENLEFYQTHQHVKITKDLAENAHNILYNSLFDEKAHKEYRVRPVSPERERIAKEINEAACQWRCESTRNDYCLYILAYLLKAVKIKEIHKLAKDFLFDFGKDIHKADLCKVLALEIDCTIKKIFYIPAAEEKKPVIIPAIIQDTAQTQEQQEQKSEAKPVEAAQPVTTKTRKTNTDSQVIQDIIKELDALRPEEINSDKSKLDIICEDLKAELSGMKKAQLLEFAAQHNISLRSLKKNATIKTIAGYISAKISMLKSIEAKQAATPKINNSVEPQFKPVIRTSEPLKGNNTPTAIFGRQFVFIPEGANFLFDFGTEAA